MATRQDLDLARRLLSARVLDEERIRAALELQGEYLQRGKVIPLERVLYARGDIPKDSLAPLREPDLLQVQPFARYRLETVLGEGGTSAVYGGTYLPNGTAVAVKVLDPIHALRPEFLTRFDTEASLLAELDHENIVAGYEHGFEAGRHFYSMDWVDGVTVLQVIDRRGRLTNPEALSITLQIASALEYLHGRNLIHRDIKPGNVMVEASGRVRLIDLGLVRSLQAAGGQEEILTAGTAEYLSPEQARGRADLDARSDVYSLGLSLYHMVVGEVPFRGADDYEVIRQQVMTELDPQKLKHRLITPEVYFFIVKMTSKDRDLRYANAGAVVRDIAAYLPGGIVPVDLGPGPAPAGRDDGPPPAAPVAPVRPPVRHSKEPPSSRRRRYGRSR